jgi:chromosome segregation ATPase
MANRVRATPSRTPSPSAIAKPSYETDYQTRQISNLNQKLEGYMNIIKTQAFGIEELLNKCSKDSELEDSPDLYNIRQKVDLTQALRESIDREEELQKQCNKLISALEKSNAKEDKAASDITRLTHISSMYSGKIQILEEEVKAYKDQLRMLSLQISPRKCLPTDLSPKSQATDSEIFTMVEANDFETAAERWRALDYSLIESESVKKNFDYLRQLLKYKDSILNSSLRDSRTRESFGMSNIINQIKEKDLDIDLLKSGTFSTKDFRRDSDRGMNSKISYLEEELRKKDKDIQKFESAVLEMNQACSKAQNIEAELRKTIENKDFEICTLLAELESIRDGGDTCRGKVMAFNPNDTLLIEKDVYIAELEQEIKNLHEHQQQKEFRQILKQSDSCSQSDSMCSMLTGTSFSKDNKNQEMKIRIARLERENKCLLSLKETLKADISRLQSLFDEERQAHTQTLKLLETGEALNIDKYKENHINTIQQKFTTEIHHLNNKLNTLKTQLRDKTNEFEELENIHRQEIATLRDALIKEQGKLKEVADKLNSEKADKDKDRQQLDSLLKQKNTEIANKFKEMHEKNAQIAETSKEIQTLRDANIRLQIDLEESNEIRNKLMDTVSDLQDKISRQSRDYQKDISDLTRTLESTSRGNDSVQELLKEKEEELEVMKDQMNSLQNDLTVLENYILSLDTQNKKQGIQDSLLKSYEQKITQLTQQIQDLKQRERKLLEEKAEFEEKYRNETKKIQSTDKQIADLRYENSLLADQLKQQRISLRDEKLAIQKEMAAQKEQMQFLQSRLKDLESLEHDIQFMTLKKPPIARRKMSANESFHGSGSGSDSDDQRIMIRNLEKKIVALEDEKQKLSSKYSALASKYQTLISRFESVKKDKDSFSGPSRDLSGFLDQLQQKDTIINYLNKRLEESAKKSRSNSEDKYSYEKHMDSPLMMQDTPTRSITPTRGSFSIRQSAKKQSREESIEEVYIKWQRELSEFDIKLDDITSSDKERRIKEMMENLLKQIKQILAKSQQDSIKSLQLSSFSSGKLLQAIQDGQLQNVEIKQLLMDKIGLEQELLHKIREKLDDDRVRSKVKDNTLDSSHWALIKLQSAENEIASLKQQVADLAAKNTVLSNNSTMDYGDTINKLEERVRILDETKKQTSEFFNKEKAQLLAEIKQLRKQKEDLAAQNSNLISEFENKEKAWRGGLTNILDQVKLTSNISFIINQDSDPLKLLTSLQNFLDKSFDISSIHRVFSEESTMGDYKEQGYKDTIKELIYEKANLLSHIKSLEDQITELHDKNLSLSKLEIENMNLLDKIKHLTAYSKPEPEYRAHHDYRESYERGRIVGISEGRQLERQDLQAEISHLHSVIDEYKQRLVDAQQRIKELTSKIPSDTRKRSNSLQKENIYSKPLSEKSAENTSKRDIYPSIAESPLKCNEEVLKLIEKRRSAAKEKSELYSSASKQARTLESLLSKYA